MKPFVFFVIALLLFSCSGGANKFTGNWKTVQSGAGFRGVVFIIKKDGNQFVVTVSSAPMHPMLLTYVSQTDVLTGSYNGADLDVKYIDSSKHISFIPRNGGMMSRPIEFEKTE